MSVPEEPLDELLAAVHASRKYRTVAPELVRHIGRRELASRRSLKEAIKETKNKLHQVGAAYFPQTPDYAQWLSALREARAGGDTALKASCRRLLAEHASTRERLPILECFFSTILAELAPVHSVVDLACGLGPLAIPWMPLAPDASYCAYDIYTDLMAFLGEFLALMGLAGEARACDVLATPPQEPAEVAFLLKAIPCLEQVEKEAGARLLAALPARHVLVSFPAHSLGGRAKGMSANYEAHFRELIAPYAWAIERFAFEGELAFLVTKQG